MNEAYIVEAVRSPVGKFLGSLSGLSATQLGSYVLQDMAKRIGFDRRKIDGMICGNVISAGVGQNPAKQVLVNAGLPPTISTLNVNMVCASGLRAVSLCAQSILAGDSDVMIAGGIESMSNAPHTMSGVRKFKKLGDISLGEFYGFAKDKQDDYTFRDEMIFGGLWDCYSQVHMGALVEKIASKYEITREQQDRFALESHKKAASATENCYFRDEIVQIKTDIVIGTDEGIRKDTDMEKLGKLKPAFDKNGTVTAGNSSQLSDGASFLLLASGNAVKEFGLKPLAKIESYAEAGIDPEWYGLSPIDSIGRALRKAELGIGHIGIIELNEAFAAQMLGDMKELDLDPEIINVNGGAIALGHPIGASGARILTTLVHAMNRKKREYGIASLCHGGGGSASMVVSRV